MKSILIIGGTGVISSAVSALLAETGWAVTLLNRGKNCKNIPEGIKTITGNIRDENTIKNLLQNNSFDVVADFIAYTKEDAERDYRLFFGLTQQYIFISSASVYEKPLSNCFVTESTPLRNPYWQYARDKIACEDFFLKKYRSEGFPITIIRPGHTYSDTKIPLGVHGNNGSWPVVKRILAGKPVIIHGDGTSLWTVTHSKDFAKGFAGLAGNLHAIGQTVHITSDETVTWNQIYQIIADTLHMPLQAVHVPSPLLAATDKYDFTGSLLGDKANSVIFQNDKLKRLCPGFTAEIRADQGIRQTIENILAHPEYQNEEPEFDLWCDKVIAAMEHALREIKG